MGIYRIRLFREFEAQCQDQPVSSLSSKKARELFCYLLINRGRPHARERLAGILWPDTTAVQAKQYLRQTLWQLQSAIEQSGESPGCLLSVEADWISIDVSEQVWLDVAEFEEAYKEAKAAGGCSLEQAQAGMLERAVALYRGDLLETWYLDWCVFERERLQNMYLAMLDKLAGYYEMSLDFQAGIECAMRLLHVDIAHERTYRRLMRLYYYAGDRTSALRQFQRCEMVLERELGVSPSVRTVQLMEQIKSEELLVTYSPSGDLPAPDRAAVNTMLNGLAKLNDHFAQSQRQLAAEIDAIRSVMTDLL